MRISDWSSDVCSSDLKRKIEALRPIEIISVTGDRIMGGWNLVDKVQIGGFSITNLPVVFADVSPFHQLHLDNKPALLLGMDVLQRFDRIAVDFGRKRVPFLLPDGLRSEERRLRQECVNTCRYRLSQSH